MTLQEYNIKMANSVLDNDSTYKYYRDVYNLFIDIRTISKEDLNVFYNEKEITQINKMFNNIEYLKLIADGKKLDPLYCLYYNRFYSNK